MFLAIVQPVSLVPLHLTILLATHFIHSHSQQESVHSLTNACHQASRCLVNLIYIIYRFNFMFGVLICIQVLQVLLAIPLVLLHLTLYTDSHHSGLLVHNFQ